MNDAAKKISADIAAKFAKWLESPEVKAAIETTRAASDEDAGTFEVVITTENIDRYNEIIKLDGWETANYMNNPVVLLSHDSYMPPIGVTTSLEVRDGKMIARGKFAPASANPTAQQIRQLYDLGIMRATSVGFIEKDREANIITKAELLEFSFVSIPANPFALSTMVKSGLSINDFITKGLISVKEREVQDNVEEEVEETPAPEEPEPEEPKKEEPKPEEPTVPESEPVPDGKAIRAFIAQVKEAVVALEATVKTDEPEGDEGTEDGDTEEAKKFQDFSRMRRVVQEAATVLGDVLAEARRAIEVSK